MAERRAVGGRACALAAEKLRPDVMGATWSSRVVKLASVPVTLAWVLLPALLFTHM